MGHCSGCMAPRCAHTVCQSRRAGTATGGCPSATRQWASAAAGVGWESPEDRTTRVCGAGTGRSTRGRTGAPGTVIRWGEGLPASASSWRAREPKVTRSPSQATSRACLLGPPRRERAREITTPAPGRERSMMRTCHCVLVGWPNRVRRLRNGCGRRGSGHPTSPCPHARRIASSLVPRNTAITTRAGNRTPLRPATQRPSGVRPPP
jgi:hypothetical protein